MSTSSNTGTIPVCSECKSEIKIYRRRGLCRKCYYNPVIRRRYPKGCGGQKEDETKSNELIRLYQIGLTDKQIAKATGRTLVAIIRHRHRLGLMRIVAQ